PSTRRNTTTPRKAPPLPTPGSRSLRSAARSPAASSKWEDGEMRKPGARSQESGSGLLARSAREGLQLCATRNLQFSFCNSQVAIVRGRSGVTILEVMFAILVTAIGLLGAASLLPVASYQARRARSYDTFAAAGRAALSRFDAMGMRQPDHW